MNWDFTGMSRPGPGVPPGAPRKKGAARFWEMLTRDFGSLLGANLLCFAAFLPAALAVSLGLYLGNFWVSLLGGLAGGALAGPFYMALADTALRTLQDDPTGWFGRWRSTLAGHWRPAAVTGLALGGLIAVFLFVGSFFLAAMQQEELPALPIWMVLAVDFFLLSLFGVTLPFQLALGRPGFLARLKEGALELLFHPGRVAGAALFQLLWWALLLAMFPISVPFALFLGFWPAALLTGQMLYPVLQSRFELPDYRPAPSPAVGDLVAAALGPGAGRRLRGQLRAGHRLHPGQPLGPRPGGRRRHRRLPARRGGHRPAGQPAPLRRRQKQRRPCGGADQQLHRHAGGRRPGPQPADRGQHLAGHRPGGPVQRDLDRV